jgi:hypothetical protein
MTLTKCGPRELQLPRELPLRRRVDRRAVPLEDEGGTTSNSGGGVVAFKSSGTGATQILGVPAAINEAGQVQVVEQTPQELVNQPIPIGAKLISRTQPSVLLVMCPDHQLRGVQLLPIQ